MLSGLDFTFSSLMSAFVFSVAGFWLFKQGKQKSRFQILLIGVSLMIYPYFTSGPWADWGVGIALCGLAYHLWSR